MAQDATVADPRRADAASVHPVAPDVTLRTRVADPALLQASRRFDALDANGDGLLDRSDADPASFDRLDGDHDGRLDRDEYTAQARR
ncbi:MAG: EF-hand domain-containing protein [Xanthomonadaceae bacterium]|uniref:EF-hand domain-containing protein n=2 Tax=Luteimonas wenzhouensis TaxID=2599615 RepID=A0A5C5U7T4_9GAMM|nr:EF-hand domain-containing protein [Xanthomonadaceae bacterium]TWT22214.1 EF-hand domain-containing protein [Luteimonas wenzhouensis]